MHFRRTAAVLAASLAVGLAGCGGPRQVSDVPDDDRPTPDETPIIEPVSPPANEVERPDDEDG